MSRRIEGILAGIGKLLDEPEIPKENVNRRFSNSTGRNVEPFYAPNYIDDIRTEQPVFPLSQLEGHGVLFPESDVTAHGATLVGIGNKPLARPVELNTGVDHIFYDPESLWKSDEKVVKKLMNRAERLKRETGGKDVYLLPFSGFGQSSDFFTGIGRTMMNYNLANAPASTVKQMDNIIRDRVPTWKGSAHRDAEAEWNAIPAGTRMFLTEKIDKELRNQGSLSEGQARVATARQEQLGVDQHGQLRNVGVLDVNAGWKPSKNPDYNASVFGEGAGVLDIPEVTAYDLLQDRVTGSGRPLTNRSLQYADTSKVITEKDIRAAEKAAEARGVILKSGIVPTVATLGTGIASLLGTSEPDAAIIPALSQATQRGNTLATAKSAVDYLDKKGATGKSIDYGAGFGTNAEALGIMDTFEPFPQKGFDPTFRETAYIPTDTYGRLISTNVLNVIPPEARAEAVKNIGLILKPDGTAVIQTRSASAVNELKKSKTAIPQEEPASFLTRDGTYQKGYTRDELQSYVQGILGDNFQVEKVPAKDIPNGAAVSVKKLSSLTLPTAVATTGLLGGQEEAEAAGLVGMVPAIAKKMLDDPNTPKKNNPQGWANYLKKQGAKSTEIDKYDLDLIQTDRQLSKEEVSQYLLDNEYKLGRTLRTQYPTELDNDLMRANVASELRQQNPNVTDAEIAETTDFYMQESLPLHMGDRSSGNIENYREQVLEDPSGMQINEYINKNVYAQQQLAGELRELHNAIKSNSFVLDRVGDDLVKVPMDEMVSRYTKKQIQREHLKRLRNQAENRTFVEASHFPEPNVAGHVRTTDRINSFDWRTGKKTQYRLIEEVQSDWVQRAENPEFGVKDIEKMDNLYDAMYESKVAQYKAMANASPDKREDVFNEYLGEQADISRRLEELGTNNFRSKVPPPPITKPHIPLVNQTIIDAVEEGMDGIGIVTGETQLVAKDQFQFINDISWQSHKLEGDKEPNILFDFSGITNRQGDVGEVHTQLSMNVKSDLEDFRKLLPKGKADEIIDQVRADIAAGKESGIMSNFNAQVEGKKLRPYYNKTLRKHLEQLGKQYGVKVEKRKNTEEFRIESDDGYHSVVREDGVVMEEFDDLREAQEYYDKRMMAVDDHFYLPFTDKMKEDIKKNGLKLFSVMGLTPVAIDAMRASLDNQDEKLQFIYDDRYTQREENRAAIEDMLARDAKQDKVDGILNTISNVAAFPAAVGEGLTESVLEAASFIPEAFATAGEYLSGDPESKNYRENVRGLLNPEVEASSERSRMLRDKMAQNFRVNTGNLYDAAEPYLKALLEQDMLPQSVLEQSSMADAMRGIRSAYRNMDAGYLKDNLIPAAGYGILGALGALDFYRRGLVNNSKPLEGELIPPQQTLQQPASGLLDRPFIDAESLYVPQGLLN